MKNFTLFVCIYLLVGAFCAADSQARFLPLDSDRTPIGLDDMYFSQSLGRVLVPSGRTGKIQLIDPATASIVDSIGGFATQAASTGERWTGPTSVDEAGKLLLVTNRSTHQLDVVDPKSKRILSAAPLEAGPDYVRNVPKTEEVWVTEPRVEKIEIFRLPPGSSDVKHSASLEIKGGPEALVIDNTRAVAYTNIDGGKTLVIDLKSRAIIHEWSNGCEDAEGALLGDSGRFLFIACREGKVVSIDPDHGDVLSSMTTGAGVDIIAYNPKLRHIYAPGSKDAKITILSVSAKGELSIVQTLPGVEHGHCVVADDHDNFYVCDPNRAGLLVYHDDH
jgi:DNA-binding beta-propeller fold protein YncE